MKIGKIIWLSPFLATVLIFSTIPSGHSSNSIEIYSLNSKILPTDNIFITGFVNVDSFYKPVKLEVLDPNGQILYSPKVNFNDNGQFSWLIHPPQGKFEFDGTYTIIASHEDISETSKIHFQVLNEERNSLSSTQFRSLESDGDIISENFMETNQLKYFIPVVIISFIVFGVLLMRGTLNRLTKTT